ncbi:Phosphatidylinositol 3-/4-kinase catalytic [Neofusicoccum parvum]|uniref:Phosphatidylinositol 3-/4-kinase catalytic n=1 Tax=Neofusicoccum parvum TaxID=310453 RepID=A0ACB5SDT9_9PEZI|nr:Phosphatidylinositol 3-/4-kinase catalytic [Neofusicoccum parvum]GME61438.1 Phosphatidylinositol 3-/4-kinase catalytic [Neofusicoccum parvum]
MSWNLLERFIESDHFNEDPSLSVAYLSRYADHVGIHYVLCSKLRRFSYDEIEFFLPQLCHLLISVDNESMALEEFIIDLCEESVNAALLTFWLFQTYLHDLAGNPQSNDFKTCRRLYNKVQRIVFGASEPANRDRIRGNVLPVTVLSSLILATVAAPFLPRHAGPLAVAQARKPRMSTETISDASQTQTQKLVRSNTVAGGSPRPRKPRPQSGAPESDDSDSPVSPPRQRSKVPALEIETAPARPAGQLPRASSAVQRPSLLTATTKEARLSCSSLPDFRSSSVSPIPTPPATAGLTPRPVELAPRRDPRPPRPLSPSALSRSQKIRILRSNYFRSETQFLSALEDISNRLVIVPKPARLSALRAELALIAQDLPAEVDIPIICPPTLEDGAAAHSKHHRIVRLNPAEATSLNSAERVPYLLMVEVLREDFDFNPDSEVNQTLLTRLLAEKGTNKRRLFDLSDSSRQAIPDKPPDPGVDSVFEPTDGDLGSKDLLIKDPAEEELANGMAKTALASNGYTAVRINPAPQMLAQLEASGSKRPKTEMAAIKSKIIASMQNLEEQSFYMDETPTFDSIMAEPKPTALTAEPEDLDDAAVDPNASNSAGAARMENDSKTGGIQRKGDRDDPSAATFGEDWTAKKERIRRSSPYGWMKNWDLISVIVKTGADLRQEAFACQLIQVCCKIWQDAEVPVWVKRMRILVTGESSGLIETITNGVSLHSLKRSLTLASIAAGTNPRKRIATLRDHFVQTFGEADSETNGAAVDAFARSLAAYSIISYVLQLKDRHNGNILIDNQGHIIHIDFGFMLSNTPGSMGFEAAPFKLTQEYVDVLGGVGSPGYNLFKMLCKQAFQALRKEAERIVMLVEMMGKSSQMPCFAAGVQQAVAALRSRFMLQLSKEEAEYFVDDLIGKSVGSYYTRLYDTFQYRTQGIY